MIFTPAFCRRQCGGGQPPFSVSVSPAALVVPPGQPSCSVPRCRPGPVLLRCRPSPPSPRRPWPQPRGVSAQPCRLPRAPPHLAAHFKEARGRELGEQRRHYVLGDSCRCQQCPPVCYAGAAGPASSQAAASGKDRLVSRPRPELGGPRSYNKITVNTVRRRGHRHTAVALTSILRRGLMPRGGRDAPCLPSLSSGEASVPHKGCPKDAVFQGGHDLQLLPHPFLQN